MLIFKGTKNVFSRLVSRLIPRLLLDSLIHFFLRAIQESLQEYQGIPSSQLVVATGSEEPLSEGREREEQPREESDLELALRLSQEAKEEEDRRRKEEEDRRRKEEEEILQKVLQLSVEEK